METAINEIKLKKLLKEAVECGFARKQRIVF